MADEDWSFAADMEQDLFPDQRLPSIEPVGCDLGNTYSDNTYSKDEDWWYGSPDEPPEPLESSFARDPIFDTGSVVSDFDFDDELAEVIQGHHDQSFYTDSPSTCPEPIQQTTKRATVSVEIPESTLLIPRSCYEPFEPGVPIVSERQAVNTLLQIYQSQNEESDFIEFELNEFAIYFEGAHCPLEMRTLSDLATKMGHTNFLFSGVLSVGDTRLFVKRVPICALPIDNYGSLMEHTVRGNIWVQSRFNSRCNVYYKLGQPAKEYLRFFEPFLWVADLAKHFVDFLKVMGENNRKVRIHHFRLTFGKWLRHTHKQAPDFLAWLAQHPSPDFRSSIVANLAFLHKEAIGVLESKSTYYHTIWAETWEFDRYKGFPITEENPPTVVTQYTYDCFKHLPFGDRLLPLPISAKTERLRDKLTQVRHLELPSPLHDSPKHVSTAPEETIRAIQPGDTISTHRDEEGSGTQWRREISRGDDGTDRWFALVQDIRTTNRGWREFDVLWYYRPVDTLCGVMKYPWHNELFLSDHCSCVDRCRISEDEVLGVHDVNFGGLSTTAAEFFCRQSYNHQERRWVSLREEHKRCEHKQTRLPEYVPGDTLLVHLDLKSQFSEPCELVSIENGTNIRLRRLLRRKEVDPRPPTAPPNELVYTDEMVEVRKCRIQGPCHVKLFRHGENIPTPYDRNGVGNCFYITHREEVDGDVKSYVPLGSIPPSLRQGFDPRVKIPRLRGLDLFCGGGNFGRGLEDGGGIQMNWANDYESKAIHTYMANTQPGTVSPFLGSIDDLQRRAIEGEFSQNVPRVGDVDFISGGSPCPGFSSLTNDKTTIKQRKNQSLVAAFGSFIDLYRPRFGLLENVTGIVQTKINKDQDVFSQLICAIVGLGYQTQFFFLDASQCGSSQRRSRVFLAFAAPGHALPQRPPQTHSHPPHTKSMGLGFLPNGLPMAEREMPDATPFKFISAQEATADLPLVYDAKPDICVPFPDHRISLGQTKQLRTQIYLIPTRPYGLNFAASWYGADKKRAGSGVLTAAERDAFPGDRSWRTKPSSNSWGRTWPNRTLETVTTAQNPGDAKQGRQLHWREPRVMTVMEARRAQGFLDEEVLLGRPSTQYKIVGNSVAREVAVSLGVVFREAWVESLRGKGIGGGVEIKAGRKALPLITNEETLTSGSDTNMDDASDTTRGTSHHLTPGTTITPSSSRPTSAASNGHPHQGSQKRKRSSTLTV